METIEEFSCTHFNPPHLANSLWTTKLSWDKVCMKIYILFNFIFSDFINDSTSSGKMYKRVTARKYPIIISVVMKSLSKNINYYFKWFHKFKILENPIEMIRSGLEALSARSPIHIIFNISLYNLWLTFKYRVCAFHALSPNFSDRLKKREINAYFIPTLCNEYAGC